MLIRLKKKMRLIFFGYISDGPNRFYYESTLLKQPPHEVFFATKTDKSY